MQARAATFTLETGLYNDIYNPIDGSLQLTSFYDSEEYDVTNATTLVIDYALDKLVVKIGEPSSACSVTFVCIQCSRMHCVVVFCCLGGEVAELTRAFNTCSRQANGEDGRGAYDQLLWAGCARLPFRPLLHPVLVSVRNRHTHARALNSRQGYLSVLRGHVPQTICATPGDHSLSTWLSTPNKDDPSNPTIDAFPTIVHLVTQVNGWTIKVRVAASAARCLMGLAATVGIIMVSEWFWFRTCCSCLVLAQPDQANADNTFVQDSIGFWVQPGVRCCPARHEWPCKTCHTLL